MKVEWLELRDLCLLLNAKRDTELQDAQIIHQTFLKDSTCFLRTCETWNLKDGMNGVHLKFKVLSIQTTSTWANRSSTNWCSSMRGWRQQKLRKQAPGETVSGGAASFRLWPIQRSRSERPEEPWLHVKRKSLQEKETLPCHETSCELLRKWHGFVHTITYAYSFMYWWICLLFVDWLFLHTHTYIYIYILFTFAYLVKR